MKKTERESAKTEIRRIAKRAGWSLNVITQPVYDHLTTSFKFYIHPAEFVEMGKEIISE